jgi:NADH-quinone oxidoreductase subunit M
VAAAQAGPIQPRFEYIRPWFNVQPAHTSDAASSISLQMHLGLDGISMMMIMLATLLTVSAVLVSWKSIEDRSADFYATLLALESGIIGVFCAFDLVLFYAFFEITLIPMFLLLIGWGGPRRKAAGMKFFLYTLCGGLITLLGLVALILTASRGGVTHASSLPELARWLQAHPLDSHLQNVLFLAICAGFLVKIPVFPFHSWLPETYVESPTAGSMLVSGLLAKLGTYGFLRLCLPLFPEASINIGLPVIGCLCAIAVIYASLCALAASDMKRLVAYSSIAHVGLITLGLFALNPQGLAGGVLQMANHGLSTGALFLLVGILAERFGTRRISDLGGVATRMPLLACSLVFIVMSSIGLPGLNGFIGEFLSLMGMFERHWLYAVLGTTGVVLGAWYTLSLLQSVLFGPEKTPASVTAPVADLNLRECLSVLPLAVLCLWIGIYPKTALDLIRPDVESLAAVYAAPAAPLARQQTELNLSQSGIPSLSSLDLRSGVRDGN